MRTIFVSEIPMLDNFDIVRLIDDHTKELEALSKKVAVIQSEDKK